MIFCLTEKSSHVVNISLTKIYFLNQSNQIANNRCCLLCQNAGSRLLNSWKKYSHKAGSLDSCKSDRCRWIPSSIIFLTFTLTLYLFHIKICNVLSFIYSSFLWIQMSIDQCSTVRCPWINSRVRLTPTPFSSYCSL